MTNERFNALVDHIIETVIKDLLVKKGNEYSLNGDRLQNFKHGSQILGGTTAETLWAYLTKHLTSLRDMIKENAETGKKFSKEIWADKYSDYVNYGILLAAILYDDPEQYFLPDENKED